MNKYSISWKQQYVKDRKRYIKRELAIFIITAIIVGGGIFALAQKKESQPTQAGYTKFITEQDAQKCFQIGDDVFCDERIYKDVKWNYEIETVKAIVTQYTPYETCRGGLHRTCVTAMGTRPVEGVTAACPRAIRLGTKIWIGRKKYICEDRTSHLFGIGESARYDLFVQDFEKAIRWGKKEMQVTILYE